MPIMHFSQTYQYMSIQLGGISNSGMQLQYLFQMKRIQHSQSCRVIQVDFSPFVDKSSGVSAKVFPIFNTDKKAYMPSFILPVGKSQYEEQEKLYAGLHEKKVLEASEQREQIFVPKPSKKNSCCCICRVIYEDYLTHVTNPKHIQALRSSDFNKDIKQLCSRFQDGKRSLPLEVTIDNENINQNPKKKRKCANKEKKISKPHQQHSISTMIETSNLGKQLISIS